MDKDRSHKHPVTPPTRRKASVNRKKKLFLTVSGFLFVTILITFYLYVAVLDLTGTYIETEQYPYSYAYNQERPVKYFGIVSRYPPHIIYQGYQPLMNYLSNQTEYEFRLKLSISYDDTMEQLASGEIDAAFLGSYIYASSRHEHNLKSILKPLNENREAYRRSVFITRKNSTIHGIADLRGKKLALASRRSLSGNWVPLYTLSMHNLAPEDLAAVTNYAYHHTVVYKVLQGEYDAGAVRDRVAMEFKESDIRIFHSSAEIPTSPVVVSKSQDPYVVDQIRNALLNLDMQAILADRAYQNWDLDLSFGFTESRTEDYDFIQNIMDSLGEMELEP